ncbi:hypothetical protein B0H14DRAFT_3558502 [Mycena olivaceomarginata]|nr:hypothetical protein B0H14DRAFT_3558502 [Mycena olivaceomarginata]
MYRASAKPRVAEGTVTCDVSHLENFPLTTTITDAAVDPSPAQKDVSKWPPMPNRRSSADQEYLDSLSGRQLMDFRNYLFSPMYIKYNAGQFLDHNWVNIDLFRDTPSSASVRIKIEARAPLVPDVVKAEPEVITGGREVLELLSESEPDDNDEASDLEVMEISIIFGELQDTGAATTASSDDGDNTDDD